MNSEVFLKESVKYITDSYNKFRQYQSEAFEILKFFDELCKNNNITYYLAFGTMLGAVRDNSVIPWDYDIDVWVPYTMRSCLLSALEKIESDKFDWISTDKEVKYSSSCLKIFKKGYPFSAVHIDIYYLVGLPNNQKKQLSHVKKLSRFKLIRKRKYHHIWFKREQGILSTCIRVFNAIVTSWINGRLLRKIENAFYSKYPLEKSKYCFSVGDPYGKTYYTSDFSGSECITLNQHEFYIPKGYKRILSIIYSDYNKYPQIQKRFDEFYKMLNVVQEREERYSKNEREYHSKHQ